MDMYVYTCRLHVQYCITFVYLSLQVSEALELCLTHHIVISEELAERMTPEKHDNGLKKQICT